jgi:hypothetical protein
MRPLTAAVALCLAALTIAACGGGHSGGSAGAGAVPVVTGAFGRTRSSGCPPSSRRARWRSARCGRVRVLPFSHIRL